MKKLILTIIMLFVCNLSMAQNAITQISIKDRLNKYAVEIVSVNPNIGRCSGVVVRKTKYETHILTAKHCVHPTEEQYVETSEIFMIITSATDDLALMIVDGNIVNKEVVKLSDYDAYVGETVFHIGFPKMVGEPFISSGAIFRISKDWHWGNFDSIPGCSGGGVFNSNNELVGTLWGGLLGSKISIYEPVSDVKIFLNEVYERLK